MLITRFQNEDDSLFSACAWSALENSRRPCAWVLVTALLAQLFCACRSEAPTARSNIAASAGARDEVTAAVADAALPPSPSAERRFALQAGRVVVVDGQDHVAIHEADGGVSAESWCGTNGIDYTKASSFFGEVQRLVRAADKNGLADRIQFPLRAVPAAKTRAAFLTRYDQILSASVVDAVTRAEPAAVFCKNGAFMLGDGLVWASADDSGAYRVTTINRPLTATAR